MILAGDLERAVRTWEREGGSARGWNRAESMLRERHADASPASINAVIDRAQQVVQIGRRYNIAGENYRPPESVLPDVRRLESGSSSNRPGDKAFFHVANITVRDPLRNNAVVQVLGVKIQSDSLLDKGAFELRANALIETYLRKFVDYNRTDLAPAPLNYDVALRGVYIGYAQEP